MVLLLILVVLVPSHSYADIRDEWVGIWNIVTVRTLGKERVRFAGLRARVTKLRNGTFKSVGTGTIKGLGRIRSESWDYPNGTSEGVAYINGDLEEISTGTWKIRGNRVLFSTSTDTLRGRIRSSGYTVRINRDKTVSYLKIGRINQTTTHTRVKR